MGTDRIAIKLRKLIRGDPQHVFLSSRRGMFEGEVYYGIFIKLNAEDIIKVYKWIEKPIIHVDVGSSFGDRRAEGGVA